MGAGLPAATAAVAQSAVATSNRVIAPSPAVFSAAMPFSANPDGGRACSEPAADCRKQRDVRSVAQHGSEAARVADALRADEDVHVAADFARLVQHARHDARVTLAERPQSVAHRTPRDVDADVAGAARVGTQEPGQVERDVHTRAARTQTIGGSPSASAVQLSPSSREANSLPLRVPK